MEKYGFVYIWYDRKHKRFYIGAHWGTEDDSYVCSSHWMKQAYKKRPQDFKRRILQKIYTSKKDTFIVEDKWLKLIKLEELRKRYYNLRRGVPDYWHSQKNTIIEMKISEKVKELWQDVEYREKMSTERKNRWNDEEYRKKMSEKALSFFKINGSPNKGKIRSEEHKRNLSEALKGRVVWNKGKKDIYSEEVKKKMSRAGSKLSEETKKKMSEARKKFLAQQQLENTI